MSNPYAPPATREDVPEKPSNKDSILRQLGALSMGYVVVRAFGSNLSGIWGGMEVIAVCIYGFLRGQRKFHLGIALFMALSIAVQAYFVNRAISHPERIPVNMGPHPWLDFARAILPHTIALACATALYVRARRSANAGVERETP